MKAMTETQRKVVERLLTKGWVEPLQYRSCVYLFLPHVTGGRQERVVRDWRRKPIRISPDGLIAAVSPWDCGMQDEATQEDAAAGRPRSKGPARRSATRFP
jgi:hypothetical protein